MNEKEKKIWNFFQWFLIKIWKFYHFTKVLALRWKCQVQFNTQQFNGDSEKVEGVLDVSKINAKDEENGKLKASIFNQRWGSEWTT